MRKLALMLLVTVAGTGVSFGSAHAATTDNATKDQPKPKHVVASGESLSSIATDNQLPSWRPIWNANGQLGNPDQINPGDELTVPNPDEQIPDRPLPPGYGEPAAAPAPAPVTQTAPTHVSYQRSSAAPVYGNPNGLAQRVCQHESGCNYAINTGNGYYGAYQFDIGTWGNYGGYARADLAPPAVQDAKFAETYARRGCSPWPNTCY